MSIRTSLFALFLSVLMICPAFAKTRVVIGTAGTVGALYPMGVAMSETINRHSESIQVSAESTAGSIENIRLLDIGELNWGIAANEIAYQAYNGLGLYTGHPVKNLRALFSTVGSYVQVFAAANSDINSIEDFRGKRIGVGAPGSGGERTANTLIKHYGLSSDDYQPMYMENADMTAALKNNQIDAFIITHPLRSAPLMELTTTFKAKLIPIDDSTFYKEYPYFTKTQIPADTYNDINSTVNLAASRIVMYTTNESGLTDQQVYEMLSDIWNNTSEWQNVHAAVKKNVTLERAMIGLDGVPLHPAAKRFFTEKGLLPISK